MTPHHQPLEQTLAAGGADVIQAHHLEHATAHHPHQSGRLPDRRTVNENYDFKQIRLEVTDYLLKSTDRRKVTITRSLVLPDIEPQDPAAYRMFGASRRPVRRSEIKEESVEI